MLFGASVSPLSQRRIDDQVHPSFSAIVRSAIFFPSRQARGSMWRENVPEQAPHVKPAGAVIVPEHPFPQQPRQDTDLAVPKAVQLPRLLPDLKWNVWIRAVRESLGLSEGAFAEAIGAGSRDTVAKWVAKFYFQPVDAHVPRGPKR